MSDVFMQPILGMLDKLGISKTASEVPQESPAGLSNSQLVKELGKLAAGDMPEELAGQKMHDENTPMDTPEPAPAPPKIENTKDDAYRLQQRTDDNLDSLTQTSAPLSNPSDLDTNQDPLARMAAKIASAIEPVLQKTDASLSAPASRLQEQINKTAAPSISAARQWIGAHPERTAGLAMAGGAAIGGGLGFFGGKMHERKKDETEDGAIFDLGAQVGGQAAANQIIEQLSMAAQQAPANKEG